MKITRSVIHIAICSLMRRSITMLFSWGNTSESMIFNKKAVVSGLELGYFLVQRCISLGQIYIAEIKENSPRKPNEIILRLTKNIGSLGGVYFNKEGNYFKKYCLNSAKRRQY